MTILTRLQFKLSRIYIPTYCALILLCILSELWLMPLRPGGSWLWLKAVPLLLGLRGVVQRNVYTLQWVAMLLLLYLAEGSLYLMTGNTRSALLGGLEMGLAIACFLSMILYLRPLKQAAKQKLKNTPPNAISKT